MTTDKSVNELQVCLGIYSLIDHYDLIEMPVWKVPNIGATYVSPDNSNILSIQPGLRSTTVTFRSEYPLGKHDPNEALKCKFQ